MKRTLALVTGLLVLLDREGEVVNTWQGHTEKAFFDEQFGAVLGP